MYRWHLIELKLLIVSTWVKYFQIIKTISFGKSVKWVGISIPFDIFSNSNIPMFIRACPISSFFLIVCQWSINEYFVHYRLTIEFFIYLCIWNRFWNRNKYFTAKILIRFMTFTQSSIFTANIFAFCIKNRGQYLSGDYTLKKSFFPNPKTIFRSPSIFKIYCWLCRTRRYL